MSILMASLIFGGIAAILAHNKARNALGWFIIGCLIGPFALAVTLLPMAVKQGVTKACPKCQEAVRTDAQICRYCRSDLRGLRAA